jgi:hypothetical protein
MTPICSWRCNPLLELHKLHGYLWQACACKRRADPASPCIPDLFKVERRILSAAFRHYLIAAQNLHTKVGHMSLTFLNKSNKKELAGVRPYSSKIRAEKIPSFCFFTFGDVTECRPHRHTEAVYKM